VIKAFANQQRLLWCIYYFSIGKVKKKSLFNKLFNKMVQNGTGTGSMKFIREYDVVVAGAGPAGSMAAYTMAREGA
jgi:ribulose 1,5-bisphosphate synthetase/thiazole synthase